MIVPQSEPLLTTTSAVRNAEPRGGQARPHGIIGRLAAARRGERNRLLFWASVRISELVAEGDLDAVASGQALADAAASDFLSPAALPSAPSGASVQAVPAGRPVTVAARAMPLHSLPDGEASAGRDVAAIGWPGEKSGYSSQRLSNSGRPVWTGAVLWIALNVRRKRR